MKNDELRIKTPAGDLIVKDANDETYPGVNIYLERNGNRFLFGIMEVKLDEEEPILATHIYDVYRKPDDPKYDSTRDQDEPVFDWYLTMVEIDNFFKGDAD